MKTFKIGDLIWVDNIKREDTNGQLTLNKYKAVIAKPNKDGTYNVLIEGIRCAYSDIPLEDIKERYWYED